MRATRLPLGVDIGHARVRIAEMGLESGVAVLRRVDACALEHDGASLDARHLGRTIADLLRRSRIGEHRCVCAVGEPDATMRSVTFPPMPLRERERAAQFEAARFVPYPSSEAWVRTRSLDARTGLYAIGILRRPRLHMLTAVVRAAGLRLVAVDHESYALQRSFPNADAVLDIGHASTRLYVFGLTTPFGAAIDGGAQAFTNGIARALAIDPATAERRKRAIGLAGSAAGELDAFAHSVGRTLLHARNQGAGDVQRLILVGNGARLPGLSERLERDTGCSVEIAAQPGVARSGYPVDVIRASAPDWALSVGLALWSLAKGRAA